MQIGMGRYQHSNGSVYTEYVLCTILLFVTYGGWYGWGFGNYPDSRSIVSTSSSDK